MSEFYRAFEDKHRGSRELILGRLAVYQPFIEQIKARWDLQVLDLGCGRGEWLELLTSMGVRCHGVDLDENMLAACQARGFDVSKNDALTYMKALPTASQMAVSAFHLVEHIPFVDLQTLVQEARRVLVPGGLLILETPNPENLRVGTCNFYMDPTHVNPLPPQLLQFLPDHFGYARSTILRLQEPAALQDIDPVMLTHVLNGVSPDFSVIAQTSWEDEGSPELDALFEADYGVTVEGIAAAYDERVSRIELRAAQTLEVVEGLRVWAEQSRQTLDAIQASSEHTGQILEAIQARAVEAAEDLITVETNLVKKVYAMRLQLSLLESENRALRAEASTATLDIAAHQQLFADAAARLWALEHKTNEISAELNHTRGRMHALSVIMPSTVVSSLRYASLQKSLLRRDGIKGRSKALARRTVFFAVRKLSRFPKVKSTGKALLRKLGMYQYVRGKLTPREVPIFRPVVDTVVNIDEENLSTHARTVLAKFKLAEKTRVRNR